MSNMENLFCIKEWNSILKEIINCDLAPSPIGAYSQGVICDRFIFISGKNLLKTIKDLIEFMGDREIAICKEITKINERVIREKASKCLTLLEKNILLLKGEFTIVVGHKINESPKPLNKNIKSELSNLLKKYSLTEAVKIVHNLSNISRKEIYKMAIEIKDE